MLDWVDTQVRLVRGRPELAFGGIQLIFAGDFFQLGAIDYERLSLCASEQFVERDDLGAEVPPDAGGVQLPIAVQEFSSPAFKSNVWREAQFTCVKLDKMSVTPIAKPSVAPTYCFAHLDVNVFQFPAKRFTFYQLPGYAAAGRSANAGECPPPCLCLCSIFCILNPLFDSAAQVYRLFAEELARELPGDGNVLPTVLKAKKQSVNAHNLEHLEKLKTRENKEIVSLTSVDEQENFEEFSSKYPSQNFASYEHICKKFFDKDCPAKRLLDVAEGAQVLCSINKTASCSIIQMLEHRSLQSPFCSQHLLVSLFVTPFTR